MNKWKIIGLASVLFVTIFMVQTLLNPTLTWLINPVEYKAWGIDATLQEMWDNNFWMYLHSERKLTHVCLNAITMICLEIFAIILGLHIYKSDKEVKKEK